MSFIPGAEIVGESLDVVQAALDQKEVMEGT